MIATSNEVRAISLLNVTEAIGERIKARREALGMSVSALAEQAGVDRGRLAKLEKGEVSVRGTFVGAVEAALARIEEETGHDASSIRDQGDDLVEFTIEGNFGVRAVVKGPVRDMEELKEAVASLVREMRGDPPVK